ncbi:uncharacterized protein LOC115888533 [Sitophilus oryzae]|uniref:Uncharacterized protein LOC115888533 n=1 Tax=Sitophilus oryzae TaxID=7048 RepID=A0A6J2YMT2_SITOR|nr:uncharacterized protein LOC115888533 [Sitophilus oryzae]
MEPVLQRLGDVTIQRLEKPKESKVEAPNTSGAQEKLKSKEEHDFPEEPFSHSEEESYDEYDDHSEDELEHEEVQNEKNKLTPDLKRGLPEGARDLGPEISFKRFKVAPPPEKPLENLLDKNVYKKNDALSELNFSGNDLSDYDSELESEGELQDLGSNIGLTLDQEEKIERPEAGVDAVNKDDEPTDGTSFLEKLVEQAEVPPIPPAPVIKTEAPDDDYDVDIKEKLKEMGEITFASVKKGDKPKKSDTSENEVVITKKTGEDEVTVMSKGNLRRNIREVMDETKLDESTLAAQRQEAERLRRVQEQQRLLREYQRQAQQERMQQRVMSLLQGSNFPKPGTSNQTRIGNTVLVKLPNGQTKPMTKVPRPPFDLVKMPKPDGPHGRILPHSPLNLLGAPRGYPRGMAQSRKGVNLPPSVSIAPVGKRGPPFMDIKPHSDSDSEGEDLKPIHHGMAKSKGKSTDTIEVSSDDDCIVVSESESQDDEESDDPSNSGMHTNDEFNQPDEQGRVLVNVGHAEDEPDVFVAPQIGRIIKPHQIGGVRFLYDNIVESINRFDSSTGFGCILAHSMGLGKTLQIVTFSDIFLRYTPAKTILCIMPINTLQNWMAEYNMWIPLEEAAPNSPLNAHGEVRPRNFNIHVLNDIHKTLIARHKVIHAWRARGGVLLIGYEQFRLLSMKKNPKTRKKATPMPEIHDDDKNKPIFDEIYSALVNPGPDLVICDEGHRIKNSHASISAALKQLRTKRRVVLTGYPLQNNLLEYWCMVDFVRPNYLGTKTEFLNMFERPIMNGQCIDSTEADIKLMRYRAHVLHSLLVGFVQRRSHTVLQTVLPQKEEYVLLVRMTPFQRKLYETFMNEVVRKQTVPNPLKAFAVCCKIWNHPDVLYNFLVKRAKGDAVDLDLEEVASTVSGVSTTTEAKAKKPPPKPRKPPAKGKNGKPAASITPYNSDASLNPMQPPSTAPNSMAPTPGPTTNQSQFNTGNTSSSVSNPHKTSDSNYGPYMDQFNQPRTSFEGISQLFGDHMSSQRSFDSFEQNSHFSNYNNSASNYSQEQNTSVQSSNNFGPPQSQGFLQNPNNPTNVTTFSPNPQSNFSQQSSSNQMSLLNLDNQSTVTVQNTTPKPIFPNLPSGISLTPLSSKTQTNTQSSSVTTNPTPSNSVMDVNSTIKSSQSSFTPQFNSQNQAHPSVQQNNTFGNYDTPNLQDGFRDQNFWEMDKKPTFNQQGNFFNNQQNSFTPNMPNSITNQSWIKKEDSNSKLLTPNSLVSSQKSDSSMETKPKINIISDIKLPSVFTPEKKIKIISDIKIEPKKEEDKDDKFAVKKEIENIKSEVKSEVKTEEELKPPVENALSKLSALSMKDSKEDGGIPYEWALELLKDYVPGKIENSAKMQILFCIIKESIALGDRLLVFSQSLITLDLIEQFLHASEVPGETYRWAKNVSYYRLDGSTGAQEREKLINEFNSNPKIHVFLVSTRAGSLGINLIGANRVVVLDASWNPCHDTQAVCRVYRYGQRKPCFVYRLVVDNCLEKKIYDRQVSKQGMSDRVVDECNPDAHLTIKDVSTLCFDEKYDEGEVKDWSSYKDNYIDVVLQKVLDRHGTTLNKEPFQHESLLVDRKEKQLSSQEKRLAKKGYEREKNAARQPSYLMGAGRGHRPVASVRPMQQGERPSRWIPAEHWQRQGMTAQEMTLPLDVVIPTNQPEKGNIVLKAGQKVLVLKSPKGVYMQLESGKIVAIKTAIKVKGKAEENEHVKLGKAPNMPPQIKNNAPMSMMKQNRPMKSPSHPSQVPFNFGMTKFNMKSVQKNVPNLVSKIQSVTKKVQNMPTRPKSYQMGVDIAKQVKDAANLPSSSSEDEHPHLHPSPEKPPQMQPQQPQPQPQQQQSEDTANEIQKRISQLNKNISIQRVNSQGVKQPLQPLPQQQQSNPQPPATGLPQQKTIPKEALQLPMAKPAQQPTQSPGKMKSKLDELTPLERLEQTSPTPFQETLDSITANFKNPDNLDNLDTDDEDDEDEGREPDDEMRSDDEEDDEMPDSPFVRQNKHLLDMSENNDHEQEASDQSDEVTYVSDQGSESTNQQFHPNSTQQQKQSSDNPEYNSTTGYNNTTGTGYYNYNTPPFQAPPPPQGYAYPPQHPPHYEGYTGYPPQPSQPHYNYSYQGYPPPQPHFAPPPPQGNYDYSSTAPPQPMYPGYTPYPQQYPHPPQGMYPPPPPAAPTSSYPDYTQYPNQNPPATGYYPNT